MKVGLLQVRIAFLFLKELFITIKVCEKSDKNSLQRQVFRVEVDGQQSCIYDCFEKF